MSLEIFKVTHLTRMQTVVKILWKRVPDHNRESYGS
jgi:hypothetical protein